jgi:hypothetical protein
MFLSYQLKQILFGDGILGEQFQHFHKLSPTIAGGGGKKVAHLVEEFSLRTNGVPQSTVPTRDPVTAAPLLARPRGQKGASVSAVVLGCRHVSLHHSSSAPALVGHRCMVLLQLLLLTLGLTLFCCALQSL